MELRADSHKGMTLLMRWSDSSGCSRRASGIVLPASRTTGQSGRLKGGFLAGSPSLSPKGFQLDVSWSPLPVKPTGVPYGGRFMRRRRSWKGVWGGDPGQKP